MEKSRLSSTLLKSKSCREYLSLVMSDRKQRNPRYSLRSMARDFDVSPATLSGVLNSRRQLSMELASRISKSLRTSETALDHWHSLLLRECKANSEVVSFHERRNDVLAFENSAEEIDLETFKMISEWQHAAILAAADLNLSYKPKKLAELMGISLASLKESCARLEHFRLLEIREGKLFRSKNNYVVKCREHNQALKGFHSKMLQKTQEALFEQSNEKRYTGSITLAVDERSLDELQDIIRTFMKKFIRVAEKSTRKNRIYNLNINFIDLFANKT